MHSVGLRVLREARLGRGRERVRAWRYSLDARPLAGVYGDWGQSFAPYWEESLGRLKGGRGRQRIAVTVSGSIWSLMPQIFERTNRQYPEGRERTSSSPVSSSVTRWGYAHRK